MAFVWICGATGAVGSALARRLDAKGVSMVLTARHADSLGALADTMSRERVVVAPADATDAAALDRALEAGVERFGVPDGLAHCVGSIVVKPMHSTSDSELHDAFAANYFSAWNALRAFVRILALAAGSTLILLALTFAFALILGRATGLDPALLALAYSPGGLAEMSMVALSLALEPGVVIVHHLARVVIVLVAAPFAFRPTREEPTS